MYVNLLQHKMQHLISSMKSNQIIKQNVCTSMLRRRKAHIQNYLIRREILKTSRNKVSCDRLGKFSKNSWAKIAKISPRWKNQLKMTKISSRQPNIAQNSPKISKISQHYGKLPAKAINYRKLLKTDMAEKLKNRI